jgi:hypothetical protein
MMTLNSWGAFLPGVTLSKDMVAGSLSYKKGTKLKQIISINPHFTFNRLA